MYSVQPADNEDERRRVRKSKRSRIESRALRRVTIDFPSHRTMLETVEGVEKEKEELDGG